MHTKFIFMVQPALSIYLHIPFCEVKCGYCDFFSVGRGFEDFDLQKEYVDRLIAEIEVRAPAFAGRPIRSVFFGGGTPSLLSLPLLERIFRTLNRFFPWEPSTEVTLESNPKTVSFEKLKGFRSLGVNRLSIGVQSFQDRFLKVLGRVHSGAEAKKTVEDAQKAGFDNFSIDLIFALPGQSFEDWRVDLEEGLSLRTPHMSAYHLTIESGTPFEALHRQGRLSLPTEDEGANSLEWTRNRLSQAGLPAYEISNFARPGFESVHNRNYWQYGDYLGFGTAAASFFKYGKKSENFGRRQTNIRDLKGYLQSKEGTGEEISQELAMGEFCMLALRTREGIGEESFERQFEKRLTEVYPKQFEQWPGRGWLKKEGAFWKLTEEGILFCDEVAASFL